jgi:ethanolamine utilization protein EutN
MYLGRVIGCVWATVKHPALNGHRMLVVQPLTPELTPTGRRIIATDWTGSGIGELVYWCRGKESSFPFLPDEVPTDTNIVGIVDSVTINRKAKTEAASELPQVAVPEAPARPVAAGRRGKKGNGC